MGTRAENSAKKRAYWQSHFEARRRSGLSVSRYVREHGLSAGTFYAARQRYDDTRVRDAGDARPTVSVTRFARVVPAAPDARRPAAGCRVLLRNGVVVEFDGDSGALAATLQAAAALS